MPKLKPENFHRHRHEQHLAPRRKYRKCMKCGSVAPVFDVPLPGDATLYATLCAVCEQLLSRDQALRAPQLHGLRVALKIGGAA